MAQFLDWLSVAGSVLFVLLALSFCIVSHELGHFLAGKLMGLHIDAFALGFRPVWRRKIGGVEYRIGWIWCGGYVELPQIDSTGEPKTADGDPLPPATPAQKVVTALAGPVFNILAGLLLGCVVWWCGMPQDTPKMRSVTVRQVPEASPEYRAGLRPGDRIVKLNGRSFHYSWHEFVTNMLYTIGRVNLEVERAGEKLTVSYVPEFNPRAPSAMRSEKINYPFFKPLIPLELTPEAGGPAALAGIRKGDVLLRAGGREITDYFDFQLALNFSCGKPLELTLLRAGREVTCTVTPLPVPGAEEHASYLAGITFYNSDKTAIGAVMPGSAAEAAGLQAGDVLLRSGNTVFTKVSDFQQFVRSQKDRKFALIYSRNGVETAAEITARRAVPSQIGVTLAVMDYPNPWQQFTATLEMSWRSLKGLTVNLGHRLGLTENTSSIRADHLSGALGICMVLYSSIRVSVVAGIYFMVVVSFALAIFNLLPLPVLDGGHVFFGLLEWIFRRRLPVKLMKVLTVIFIVLLVLLMIYVTFNDGRRLVRRFQTEQPAK